MTGVVTLNIELELGWGMHDSAEYGHLSSDRSAGTDALHRLLDPVDCLDLPITFDIVGNLFHDSYSGSHPGPHPESWWTKDPGTNSDTDPLFYAPDLVREIQNRETNHELATHILSFIGRRSESQELNDEPAKIDELHADIGPTAPMSIVVPRH